MNLARQALPGKGFNLSGVPAGRLNELGYDGEYAFWLG
jgi:hypothetical protein